MTAITTDQATALRRMMEQHEAVEPAAVAPHPPTGPFVIAIASGKGGVGKSNVAVNLSWSLAAAGQRVLLLDADLGTANADVLLGVRPRHHLGDVLGGRCALADAAQLVAPQLRLIPGASGIGDVANLGDAQRARLLNGMARLEQSCDVLIIDCGAGISQNVLAFAQAADQLLLVTTPEPTALADAYSLVKVASRMQQTPDLALVVNAVLDRQEGRDVTQRFTNAAARFLQVAVDDFGQIPRDPRVPLAVRERRPVVHVYPRSPAARAISGLAQRILSRDASPSVRRGFFQQIFGLFY